MILLTTQEISPVRAVFSGEQSNKQDQFSIEYKQMTRKRNSTPIPDIALIGVQFSPMPPKASMCHSLRDCH